MNENNYADINAQAIDSWIAEGWTWGIPITHEVYEAALRGEWSVLLTPTIPVPRDWFPDLRGLSVLGLASGGGQQMPVFTAAGAKCTVFDYSPRQLESERLVAEREHYNINIVRGDMSKDLPFPDESFDLIFHPVSNCYIDNVCHLWQECARVLKRGGILLAGLDNGINYLVDGDETKIINSLPFNPLKNKEQYEQLAVGNDGIQFSHTAEEQLRGQLKAGFSIVDIFEDTNGEGRLHELNIPTFWATKAIKL